ncbi:MAG: DNA polymerase III subunit beta [Prevotella sp.]|nr:DNA polymerase III subunit beta [Prevotella sp.]MCM1074204.1 DNA polymerase III subunit beta [Ruminococcus sp.]
MKFNVSSKALATQLSAVSKVINSKNALSILDNFLFSLQGNTLSVTGSDQENVMTATLEVFDVEGEGSVAVPSKRILDMLKEVPGQPLTFYVNDENKEIDIRFLNGHFNFMGIDGNEFPIQDETREDAKRITLPVEVVRRGLETTLFAVGTETIRPIMTGVYWDICPEVEEGKTLHGITFVGTDTHKLVRYINTSVNPALTFSFILPPKPANILRGLIAKEEGEMDIEMDEKSAKFTMGDFTLSCRFINGRYPNYNRVIPENNPFELTIDRVSLLNAMRRVALFASASSSLVRMNIRPNEVLLAAQDLDYTLSAEERVECEYQGNAMTIGFNATYMIEVLTNIVADTVVIKLSDPARPGIFVPLTNLEGEDLLMLLMPMQVME